MKPLRSATARLAAGLALFVLAAAPVVRLTYQPHPEVDGLTAAEGLEVTLFADAPLLSNPTNMDVDARGRVWVCEAVNYRPALNPQNPTRPEGDRIVILEDTDGDGRADGRKIYYQGPDVNAAMGIAVLGNRVIVSGAPDVLVFTDDDGDDRPDRKEVLFTGIGGVQHDHSVHAFVFGPDGKLYFNFGNEGRRLRDGLGNLVVDRAGNPVTADGSPYRQGMVFRVDPDGRNLEVLGHNFRNNYEVAVDAYGTLWQSDNDDDGNRAVRINYVMEYGNYGYQDEVTGASWWVRRTNLEPDVPSRHWHQHDPGVVPNLLVTGAGSPTGILVYEGRLLPRVFWDQVIHADAGPNVVRAYPVQPDGAGFRAEVVDLVRGTGDAWFRPSDVTVAPDGSLFIADWYDPGVGGHQVGDLERGRIFRVAPPGTPYHVPPLDLSTPDGAAGALRSPNVATRHLAWTRLHAWQEAAEPALRRLWQDDDPRIRARALWLLTRIDGRARHYVDEAVRDADPNLRITGLRAARQAGLAVVPLVAHLAEDPNPQVRREAALALRHNPAPQAPALWATLAAQHDGRDRWYLEALGIAADGQWDAFFSAWRQHVGDAWDTPAGRDLVWRSRAPAALPLLATLIGRAAPEERPRFFRAFDFHTDSLRQDVLLALLDLPDADGGATTELVLHHLDPAAVRSSERAQTALEAVLSRRAGTTTFLDLVGRYDLRDRHPELLALALAHPDDRLGVEAARLLLRQEGLPLFRAALDDPDPARVAAALTVLGPIEEPAVKDLLQVFALDATRDLSHRRRALERFGGGWSGEDRLLALARDGTLPDALLATAAAVLLNAWRQGIRDEAATLLGRPAVAGNRPLPDIRALAGRSGDAARGRDVFAAACSACHRVGESGVAFGPGLSEIGDKLPKEGLYTAILYPDAGISFGYEGVVLKLRNGAQVLGYVASETPEALELRQVGGHTTRYARADVVARTPYRHSLMPATLHEAMTEEELVDLVEYLTTLRKPAP